MGAKIERYNRVIAINAKPSGDWEVVTKKARSLPKPSSMQPAVMPVRLRKW